MFDRWNFGRWPVPLYQHQSFYAFHVSPRLGSGIHEIADRGRRLHVLFDNRRSRHLLVFFHGSLRPESIGNFTLPVFSGFHVTEGMRADHLLMSDPTLGLGSEEIQLGWFSGTSGFDLPQRLGQIISSIAARKPYDTITFIGGSGGGFAALRAAALFPGSTAIVWNPQTDISRYHASIAGAYARSCFGAERCDDIPLEIRQERFFDLKPLYQAQRLCNRVIYFQNTPDLFHIERHALPFIGSYLGRSMSHMPAPGVHQMTDNLMLVSGFWKGKHAPPPRKFLSRAIREVVRSSGADGLLATAKAFGGDDAQRQLFCGHVSAEA